jgi:RNA polymerase sigma factor (sigma-70 family)
VASIPYPRPEELLNQSGWMRDLALSLLTDPAAADDIVQEACLAALARPPSADRPLEPWLARVVRNFAWKRRRREARRAVHEREAFVEEPVPGPEATLERIELQRTVLAAVAAIPEPFRTTVVERYLQGRSSADIARSLDLPEGTVRWRLKRGLDELRERLDTRFGAREAWSVLLAPLALPLNTAVAPAPGPLARLPLEPGVLTMIGASKIVLALTLGAAAVGYLLWRDDGVERGAKSSAVLAETTPDASPAKAPERALAPAERAEQREAQAAAPKPSAVTELPAPTHAPEARPTEALVQMRFVDAQGAPWRDVLVVPRWDESSQTRSGADGRVQLRLDADEGVSEWSVAFLARRTGCATRLLRATATPGRTADLGDVLLEPGSRAEGRVLDGEGVALAGAEVGLATPEPFQSEFHGETAAEPADEGLVRRHGAEGFDETSTVKSDASGAFALDGIAPGRWRLWARAKGMRYGWTEPFDVVAGQNVFGIELRLPAMLVTDRITGIVLDPDGKPLPRARLVSSYELENESSSSSQDLDADGRFDVVLRRDAVYAFVASDPEHRYADAIATDVAPGTRELELRLSARQPFEVAVHDREGKAIEDGRFLLAMQVSGASVEDSSATRIEAGLYRLSRPALPFRMEVEADGYLPARFAELRPESVGARFEVVLDVAPRLRGRVLAEGRPVAGARVSLHRAVVDGSHWRNGFACLYRHENTTEATSDAEGRFTLTCDGPETVWLRAESPGWVTGELGPLDPLVERALEVELTVGGSIEGRVLLPDGADAAGVVVGLNHGDGHARTQRAGPEGRFRFDHLAPGRWQIVRTDDELDPSSTTVMTTDDPHEIEWTCTVEAGRTTYHDLDLSRP